MKKLAFLIGNDNYEDKSRNLCCAINDATLLTEKLEALGFECHCFQDLTTVEMNTQLANLSRKIDEYDVGLFYFAGHGYEIDSANYLACTNTSFEDVSGLKFTSQPLKEILDIYTESDCTVKIIILDACRTYASINSRGIALNSFAPISAPVGTIIAFSTSPGQSAYEMPDKSNGYYTKALSENIQLSGVPIENMFKKVRETLSAYTDKRQISWEHTSLLGDFYFNPTYLDNSFSTLYSDDALADEYYIINPSDPVGKIISDLKSYDYYIQETSISYVSKNTLEDWGKDDLFILGRNITQAAHGSCYAAQRYIKQFNSKRYSPEVSFHIINGILYEIYFDKKGNLRSNFKAILASELLKMIEADKKYSNSIIFIRDKLSKHPNRLFYLPGSFSHIDLQIRVKKVEAFHDKGSLLDEYYVIEQIYSKGIPLMTFEYGEDCEYNIEPTTTYTDFNSFEKSFTNSLLAPLSMIKFSYMNTIDRSKNVECRARYVLRYKSD